MLKIIFKNILKYYLFAICKILIVFKKPIVIAIAGSTNKHFTKLAVIENLNQKKISYRANKKNFNTEIGLPLAILDLPSGYSQYKKWLPVIFNAPLTIFKKKFPQYLVLELGTSDPGDMKYLLKIIKPKIAIITDITQRYLESFRDVNELVEEYQTLIKSIPPNGLLVYNNDNPRIKKIGETAQCKTQSFSIFSNSDFQAIDITKNKEGYSFNIKNKDNITKHCLNYHGTHHIYAHLIGEIINHHVNN